VTLEVEPIPYRERALEVIRHELDELAAGQIGLFGSRHVYCSSR
jgi:hypothetical protein